jgi:subtilisin family serine protease
VAIQRTSTTDVRYWDAFDLGFVPLGVKVISISHESEWLCADQASQDKVSAYVDAGLVIVVAAGNDDRRLDRLPGAPALARPDVPFGGNQLVSCPLAAHPRTITVGNTMLNTIQAETFWKVSGASPAQGTNRGDFVDVCAFGDGARAFGPAGGTAFTGTSAAAPLVAGTVALMRYVNPNLTVGQIRAILCTEVDLVQPTDPQWLTIAPTWASPGADWDFTVAPIVGKHNLRYGFGRVNVGKAVAKARSLTP